MIEVNKLTVNLNSKTILKDISFKIEEGQFVGIIGANGSGKSTLLKSIYKIVKPSSGEIIFNNKSIQQISFAEFAKQVAVVGQFTSTEIDYSVLEFVMMGRYPHKKRYERLNQKDYGVVHHALEFMDMDAYVNRRMSSLSGGEKQRVVIARALAQEPQCLILDEPTNHLDIKYQLQLLRKLKKIPITVIMSIHDIAFAYNFFERVITLKDGQLIKIGSPEEVITESSIKEIFDIDIRLSYCTIQQAIAVFYQ